MIVAVINMGCKVNQYESDSIAGDLAALGYEVLREFGYADAYILNTCAVTNEAECKSRQAVARCRKFNDKAVILVCGCASENNPAQFESKDGVTYVSGVAGKAKLPQMLHAKGVFVEKLPNIYENDYHSESERIRVFIKVQDGCDNFCSYCIIPYMRGRNRSRSAESVLTECESVSGAAKEIVLTGINLSAYGKDSGSSLAELVRTLKNIKVRIRLGSLEVNVIDDDFLKACGELYNFCPQFHLSLQSGDDTVLKAMNRHYSAAEYYSKVLQIREYYPDSSITTDLICGYPSESERQFENTLEFLKKVEFSDIHVFEYSKRAGTVAGKLKQLPKETTKNRCIRAELLRVEMKNSYLNKFLNTELEVLIEDGNNGYSKEYIRVYAENSAPNTIHRIRPIELYLDGVRGEMIE